MSEWDRFINALGWALIDFLWQGALLALMLALALALTPRNYARLRRQFCVSALLSCLLIPVFSLYLSWRHDVALSSQQILIQASWHGQSALILPAQFWRVLCQWLHIRMNWLLPLWLATSVLLSLRMLPGWLWLRQQIWQSKTNPMWQARCDLLAQAMRLKRKPRVLILPPQADWLASPCTLGWLRPLVLIPASVLSHMPPDLLQALLKHELAHIRQADFLLRCVQKQAEAWLFFHPAVWWISHRTNQECEFCADAQAIQTPGDAHRLALALVELAELQPANAPHQLAIPANGGELMQRIKQLLSKPTVQPPGKLSIALAACIFSCTVWAALPGKPVQVEEQPEHKAMLKQQSCPRPNYPPASVQANQQGDTRLKLLVLSNGRIGQGMIAKSSGYSALDQAALEAIRQCQATPATHQGRRVNSWIMLDYSWRLEG